MTIAQSPELTSNIMCGFFCGWKRKAGIVTLVMACLLAAEWIRTQFLQQEVTFTLHDRRHKILTFHGGFLWLCEDGLAGHAPKIWTLSFLSFIIPLTIMSAWLLLSKTRQAPRLPTA